MLFCTSLVAIVGSGDSPSRSSRRLQIINTKTKTVICELNFITPILSVKLNKKRIAVILETKIHIYDINNLKILHSIDTVPNPKGLCAFSPCSKNCFLAYPTSQQNGDVYIFDALSMHTVSVVSTHKGTLAAMAISQDGSLLATASEKGTVIRVHSVPSGNKSWTFRRGTYPAAVTSLAFSVDGKWLGAASDTGTVHIFKLETEEAAAGGLGLVSYLPGMFSQVWEEQRGIALIRLPNTGIPALCGIVPDPSNPAIARIMILTADGFYYTYTLDANSLQNSELKVVQEFSLLVDASEPAKVL